MAKDKGEHGLDPSEILSGTLDIFGLKLNLGQLLASPEEARERLEELRRRLKQAGGKEVVSDEEWLRGGASVTGHIRTRGIYGDQEFHVGTMGSRARRGAAQPAPAPPEVMEPPVDVFDEGDQVTVVADVPGADLDDLELTVDGNSLLIATKPGARRSYRKRLELSASPEPDSVQATCRNGVLEIRLRKRAPA